MPRFRPHFCLVLALLPALASALTSEQVEANIRAATTGAGPTDFKIAAPSATAPSANAADYGLATTNTGAQNYNALVSALSYCKNNGIRRLVIGPGTYNLGDPAHVPATALIDLTGFSDFTFDGQGALFLCQVKASFVNLQGCQRVQMLNYSLDWDWSIAPVQSLGQISAISADGTSIDLTFPYETSPSTVKPYELVEVDGASYNFSHQAMGVVGSAKFQTLTLLSGNTVRYTSGTSGFFGKQGAAVGQWYVARHFEYEFPGTKVVSCSNVTFQNVTTYSTLGMGYICRYCDHCQFLDSKIIRRPNTAWPWRFSSAADGIHFENNYGYVKLQNVEIGNAGDDAVNIHDTLSQGIQYVAGKPAQLLVTSASNWQYPFAVGNPVELRRDDFSPTGFQGTLTGASYASGHWTLTFGSAVPTGLPTDAIVFNHAYHSDNYIVRNCAIHHNKVRGMVVHNANGTIENNIFLQNYSPGLFILCASTSYNEGTDPANIIVRNNVFDGNDIKRKTFTSLPNNVVIGAETPQASPVNYGICQNIIFEGNLIKNCPYAALEVASANNVLVAHNTFINPNLFNDMPAAVTGTLMILAASDVVAYENQVLVESGVTSNHTNTSVAASASTDVYADRLAVPVAGALASQDVGAVGVAGSATYDNGTYNLIGSGADIWGSADSFQYTYQRWHGDGEMVVRGASLQAADAWAKAGIMWRETLAADARYALLAMTPGNGIALQQRATTGQSATPVSTTPGVPPQWLKLVRGGGRFSAWTSADGASWTQFASAPDLMAADVYVGLAVTAKSNAATCTATFDHVQTRASWVNTDVGTVGLAGSGTFSDSTGGATVSGAGAGIGGTADAFHFFTQAATGDTQITARVTAVQATNVAAQAGLMFRNGTSADAANATVVMTPGHGLSFQGRATAGATTTTQGARASAAAPWWLQLVRSRGNLNAYQSSDGVSWNWIGTQPTTLGDSCLVGLAVSAGDNGTLNTSTFDQITVSNAWSSLDVGAVGVAGTVCEDTNTFTVVGSGSDIGGGVDSFRYVCQPLHGNGSITAHIARVQNTDPGAKAGLMIRETLDAGSRASLLYVSPGNGLALQSRASPGGATTTGPAVPDATAPCWVKLERNDATITAYQSSDGGATWTTLGTMTNAMSAEAYIGLAVCAKDNSALNTAVFDTVTVTPSKPTPIVATVTLGDLTQVYDGAVKTATVTTTPANLSVAVSYSGAALPPINAGTYGVFATVTDDAYTGSATGTLTITPAALGITLGNLTQSYDGSAKSVSVTTSPAGVPVTVLYNGAATVPAGVGSYTVSVTSADPNYTGSASGTLLVKDTTPPVVTAPANLVLEATSPGGAVATFSGSATDDVDGAVPVNFTPASGSTFALGTTTVTATATDNAGNIGKASFTVTVRDTTPPTITSLTASRDTLWPVNKKMVPVTVTAAANDAVGVASLKIVSVGTNEPTSDTQWQVTGALTLNLLADRLGAGADRIYMITVEARDAAGNVRQANVAVTVPHDQGK